MARCTWIRDVERWFDGELAKPDRVARHVTACAACSAHLAALRALRGGTEAVAAREAISEAQFPAFIDDICERLKPKAGYRMGLWAFASVTAAALIVAGSTFLVFTSGPRNATATVIESASTEIEGAKVDVRYSANGTATVWVSVAEKDVL